MMLTRQNKSLRPKVSQQDSGDVVGRIEVHPNQDGSSASADGKTTGNRLRGLKVDIGQIFFCASAVQWTTEFERDLGRDVNY